MARLSAIYFDVFAGLRGTTGAFCLLGAPLLSADVPVAAGQTTEHPFVEPDAIKSEMCLTCHPDMKEGKFVHSAVAMGCESCRQARAETNVLCLSCHGVNRPHVKINREVRTVSLLGRQALTFEDYRLAAKVGLDRSGTRGHPTMGQPITGKDPRQKDARLSGLSCHTSHDSALPNLMPADVRPDAGICAQCHP